MSLTQYQIAINRKYRVKEHDGVIKSDYPWVKSFGPQADEDLNGFVRMLELDAGDHIAQARFEENRGQESMPKQL